MGTLKKRDLIAGTLFCALGVLAITILIPQGIDVPQSIEVAALSPDFWPTLIAWASIIASVALIAESIFLKQPDLENMEGEEDAIKDAQYKLETLPAMFRVLALIIALFCFYASLTTLGMVAASIILIAAMMLFFGEIQYRMITTLSISIPIVLFLFFRFVAKVPIPLGIFGA